MKRIFIVSIMVVLLLVGCVSFSQSSTNQQESVYENYHPSSSSKLHNSFAYSSDQIAVRQAFGNPTRFSIIFNSDMRFETWYFDADGYTVAFIDGTQMSEKHTVPEIQEDMYATTLSPDMFDKGMGIDEIILSTGKNEFLLTPLEDFVDNGQLMHLQGLSIGLVDGKINFVETYPAMTERKIIAADLNIPQINERTPEEIASEGLHEYLVVHYMDGDLFDSYNTMIEVRFADNKICLTENGESNCYIRVGENEYVGEDGVIHMFLILDGFIWNIEGESANIESLFSRVDD